MKQLFETFLGVFFLFLICICSMTCLLAAVDARNADKFKTEYIAQMENGDFAQDVINKVYEDAAEHEYRIEMTFYKDINGVMTVSAPAKTIDEYNAIVGDSTGTYMVRLKLSFDYSFPMMGTITKHTLMGYAK